MNDEFHKLVAQAGFELWADEDWRPKNALVDWSCNYDKELQRFAQLIVRECARVSLRLSHRDDDMGDIIARNIQGHFGSDS